MYVSDSLAPRILKLVAESSALKTWLADPLPGHLGPGPSKLTINGIALDARTMYVSKVDTVNYFVRIALDSNGNAGKVDTIKFSRPLIGLTACA